MMRPYYVAILFLPLLLFTGCGQGVSLPSGLFAPNIEYQSDKKILIGVWAGDRKIVTQMEEKPVVMLHEIGPFGGTEHRNFDSSYFYKKYPDRYDYTMSRQLSEKLEHAASKSFSQYMMIDLTNRPSENELLELIKKHEADKFLYIHVNEWYLKEKAFSFSPKFRFSTDVDVIVLNDQAQVVYEENSKESREILLHFIMPKFILPQYQTNINHFMNNDKLKMTLSK